MTNPIQRPREKLLLNGNAVALADSNPRNAVSISPARNLSVLCGLAVGRPSFVRPPSIARIVTKKNEIAPIRSDAIRLTTMPSANPPTPPTPACAMKELSRE